MSAFDSRRLGRADWLLMIGLGALLIIEVLVWQATHRADPEVQGSAASGPGEERVWALHILLNRGEPPKIDQQFIEALLASEHALVREMAMTSDVRRLGGREAQRRYLAEPADCDEATRGRYYLKRQGRPVSREILRSYFRSFERSTP